MPPKTTHYILKQLKNHSTTIQDLSFGYLFELCLFSSLRIILIGCQSQVAIMHRRAEMVN